MAKKGRHALCPRPGDRPCRPEGQTSPSHVKVYPCQNIPRMPIGHGENICHPPLHVVVRDGGSSPPLCRFLGGGGCPTSAMGFFRFGFMTAAIGRVSSMKDTNA
jgi:hypothetical protein